MLHSRLIIMSALVSFSAFGGVSFQEKVNRVEFLEELGSKVQGMDLDAYRRELNYEKRELTLEERARNEAALVAEQIRIQVSKAYEAALTDKSPGEAAAEIREAIERDSELMAPELKEEIKALSFRALDEIQRGEFSSDSNLVNVEKALFKNVKDRSRFLNEEGIEIPLTDSIMGGEIPKANPNKDSDRRQYSTKAELLESLLSDRESARWVSAGNMNIKSQTVRKSELSISMQVKAEFLGVSLSTGPSMKFKREYSTNAMVYAEGLNPVLTSDGNFDFYRRDKAGKIVLKGGKPEKRFVNFFCEASLQFSTEAANGGGFSVAGLGGGASVESTYQNSVNMASRRVLVPEYIDGKTATLNYLSQICHNDFLKGRVTNNLTVADSLNLMMKNMVSSLRFSHPKTKCARDSHCFNWYNKELIGLVKIGNYPRCVEEKRQKFYGCELRGLKGQNCTVYDAKGKRVSDGMFEFQCDTGLKCVKTQNEGWFQGWDLYQHAKGKCMPINAKTYKSPLN